MTNPLDHSDAGRAPIWRRRAAAVAAAATVVGLAAAASTTGPAGAAIGTKTTARAGKLPNTFLIGVWEQPINPRAENSKYASTDVHGAENFAYWKSQGINTLVEIPQNGYTPAQYIAWDQAAYRAGLWTMRRPYNDNPVQDGGAVPSNAIAANLPDEPDKVQAPAHMTAAQIKAFYSADKAANPTRPAYLSLVGASVAYGWKCTPDNTTACNSGAYARFADWLSVDDYPFDANHKSTVGAKNYISMIGQEMDALWKIGNPYANRMAFIETGRIGRGYLQVTAAQMKAEIWEAVAHGARGIIYFTNTTPAVKNALGQVVTPTTTYDNSARSKGGQPGVPAMMKSQNALLKSLQPILAGTINPTGISVSVSGALDAGWRKASTGRYFIVVNTSGSTVRQTIRFNGVGGNKGAAVIGERRSVHLNGAGQVTDSFAPYAVHIYQVR